jgi:ribonuclease HII
MGVSLELEHALGDPVAGVDEAGRGPLAGGVYAACVSVPLALGDGLLAGAWAGVNDSKKLSPKRRDALAEVIRATPGCVWAVASASAAEIDRLNILRATHLAMRRAVDEVRGKAESEGSVLSILVDGLPVASLPNSTNVVKGDAKSLLVAAASILAKTARDADCLRLEREYPGYGFAKHKGYPTKDHLAALAKLGPCPEHRRSFAPVLQQTLPGLG